jgi:hypothetical protein
MFFPQVRFVVSAVVRTAIRIVKYLTGVSTSTEDTHSTITFSKPMNLTLFIPEITIQFNWLQVFRRAGVLAIFEQGKGLVLENWIQDTDGR